MHGETMKMKLVTYFITVTISVLACNV